MKKVILLGATCAAMLASCAKTESIDNPVADASRQTIQIKAVNSVGTRGELYSNTPNITVDNVAVYVFDADGLYEATLSTNADWALNSPLYYTVPEGSEYDEQKTFLAIGTETGVTGITVAPTTPTAATTLADFEASVAAAADVTEIFAGNVSYTFSAEEGASVVIEISRKVAGVLGYFTKVPATVEGDSVRGIRLVVSAGNSDVSLSDDVAFVPTAFGAAYNILDISLAGQTDANNDNLYDEGNDLSGADVTVVKLEGSQLAGTYAFPIDGVTLALELYDAGGVTLKSWPVLSESGAATIDLTANNLFSLGKKVDSDSTDGDPDDEDDDDTGIDLQTSQDIRVIVVEDWNSIDYLQLGEEN